MHKLFRLLTTASAFLALAGSAQATVMGWEGTLTLSLGTLPSMVFTKSSGTFGSNGVVLNGTATTTRLNTLGVPGGVLGGTAVVPLTDPINPTLMSLRATAVFVGGTFAPIAGGAASTTALTQNVAAVSGISKLCILYPGCQFFIPIQLSVNGTKGVGLGGLITVGGYAKAGIAISMQGNPWTIKTAVIASIPTDNGGFSTASTAGFAHGPASLTSSTAQVGGVVQLVTPMIVQTSLASSPVLPLFATMRLEFVPEPGTLLLFGSGIAALGIAARRRKKK